MEKLEDQDATEFDELDVTSGFEDDEDENIQCVFVTRKEPPL